MSATAHQFLNAIEAPSELTDAAFEEMAEELFIAYDAAEANDTTTD